MSKRILGENQLFPRQQNRFYRCNGRYRIPVRRFGKLQIATWYGIYDDDVNLAM